jgi:hypothetical protein
LTGKSARDRRPLADRFARLAATVSARVTHWKSCGRVSYR